MPPANHIIYRPALQLPSCLVSAHLFSALVLKKFTGIKMDKNEIMDTMMKMCEDHITNQLMTQPGFNEAEAKTWKKDLEKFMAEYFLERKRSKRRKLKYELKRLKDLPPVPCYPW